MLSVLDKKTQGEVARPQDALPGNFSLMILRQPLGKPLSPQRLGDEEDHDRAEQTAAGEHVNRGVTDGPKQ
jgi:hypothetical protein